MSLYRGRCKRREGPEKNHVASEGLKELQGGWILMGSGNRTVLPSVLWVTSEIWGFILKHWRVPG